MYEFGLVGQISNYTLFHEMFTFFANIIHLMYYFIIQSIKLLKKKWRYKVWK